MKKISVLMGMMALSVACLGQSGEFMYMYKGEPFPYDSGVAISDRQYSYYIKLSSVTREIKEIEVDLEKPSAIIIVPTARNVEAKVKHTFKWIPDIVVPLGAFVIGVATTIAVRNF